MNIDYNTICDITLGAAQVESTDSGIIFHRFSKEQEAAYERKGNLNHIVRCSFPSGVRFSFITDSESFTIRGMAEITRCKRFFYTFDLFINGEYSDCVTNIPEGLDPHNSKEKLPVGGFEKTFLLGKGVKKVELYFPWGAKIYLDSAEIDDGAFIKPARPDKVLLCFGDSITQGYDAFHPSGSYVSILARNLGAEVFNKGIGGEVFFPALAAANDDINPDYITVAYGTNDFAHSDPKVFKKDCREFYKTLSVKYKKAKIFAISPIYRKEYKTHQTTQFASFFDVEKEIRDIAEELPNVTFIGGFDLVPHDDELFADRSVHPTCEGFVYYGGNLSKIILDLI